MFYKFLYYFFFLLVWIDTRNQTSQPFPLPCMNGMTNITFQLIHNAQVSIFFSFICIHYCCYCISTVVLRCKIHFFMFYFIRFCRFNEAVDETHCVTLRKKKLFVVRCFWLGDGARLHPFSLLSMMTFTFSLLVW